MNIVYGKDIMWNEVHCRVMFSCLAGGPKTLLHSVERGPVSLGYQGCEGVCEWFAL